jgi:hypothetical protein
MNRWSLTALIIVLFTHCRSGEDPDVSHIDVTLTTLRFEKDFFALDTNNLSSSLDALYNKYPVFFRDYSANILGLPPVRDSGAQVMLAITKFLHDYRPVYDSVMKTFPDLREEENRLTEGMRYVRYYFPQYKLPEKLITFIGPMDAFFEGSTGGYGDVITSEGLAVGLQLHLGAGFSMYHSEMGMALYPTYISRRFSREYIPVNCIKNIIDDIFPDNSSELTLVEQMVEKGKRIYLLDQLMPDTHDTLKTGYSKAQLDGCYKNEAFIWNYFLKNGLVYNNDPSLIKNYIGEAPSTPEFGEGSPGYIGLFTGWQIVKSYMEKKEPPLSTLMQTPAREIFEQSGYRPR